MQPALVVVHQIVLLVLLRSSPNTETTAETAAQHRLVVVADKPQSAATAHLVQAVQAVQDSQPQLSRVQRSSLMSAAVGGAAVRQAAAPQETRLVVTAASLARATASTRLQPFTVQAAAAAATLLRVLEPTESC
jgi:hypothetical protein